MQDEAFHEIQLNGKQLVFLFMAATVVSVVIFLCGVMVGRGVPGQRPVEQVASLDQATFDPTAALAPAPPVASTADGAPAASQETLTYPGRLEDADPPTETLKAATVSRTPAAETLPEPEVEPSAPLDARLSARAVIPAAPRAPTEKIPAVSVAVATVPQKIGQTTRPAVAAAIAGASSTTSSTAASTAASTAISTGISAAAEPTGAGFVVQVAAVRQRGEADTIARRLSGKGYPAFVTTPASAANVFRVRVGKYSDRREAESIAGRLEKEEQFKPWVTR